MNDRDEVDWEMTGFGANRIGEVVITQKEETMTEYIEPTEEQITAAMAYSDLLDDIEERELHLAEFGPLTLSDATTRDLFAGFAAITILQTPSGEADFLARAAYEFADAMMAERAKRREAGDV